MFNYFVLHSQTGEAHSWRLIRVPMGDGWDSSRRQFRTTKGAWTGGGAAPHGDGLYDSAAFKRAKTYSNGATASGAMKRVARREWGAL